MKREKTHVIHGMVISLQSQNVFCEALLHSSQTTVLWLYLKRVNAVHHTISRLSSFTSVMSVRMEPASLNNFILPELPIFDLPSLPMITDPTLYELAITHSSTHGLPRRAHELEIVEGDLVEDYEKLEHVGDGLLGQCGI